MVDEKPAARWGRIKSAAAVVSFVLLTTTSVLTIKGTLSGDSRTEIASIGLSAKDALLLAVTITNDGKASTKDVQSQFRLTASQPQIVEFGTLTNLSTAADRTIPKGGSTILHFDIDHIYIRSPLNVRTDDFWRLYGDMPVRLTGQALESDGKLRALEKSALLRDMEPFVRRRSEHIQENR